jgi:hypothetical protein
LAHNVALASHLLVYELPLALAMSRQTGKDFQRLCRLDALQKSLEE